MGRVLVVPSQHSRPPQQHLATGASAKEASEGGSGRGGTESSPFTVPGRRSDGLAATGPSFTAAPSHSSRRASQVHGKSCIHTSRSQLVTNLLGVGGTISLPVPCLPHLQLRFRHWTADLQLSHTEQTSRFPRGLPCVKVISVFRISVSLQ